MTSPDDGIRILGPLEVRFCGDAIALGGAKQRAVLALLALHADEIVPIERLIDELWHDDPPRSAAHSLEAYVSRLRQLLEPAGLHVRRHGVGYALVLGDASLDARSFARLHDESAQAAAAGDDVRASSLASAALALWRGAVLADVPLGRWASVEAERLEERRLLVFEQRVEAELRLGRHEDLVAELQAVARHHPYRERLVGLTMLALYRSGRPADALDAYEQTRLRLAEDLGLQPGTELQQLSGRIVRHDPALRLAAGRDESVTAPQRTATRLLALAGAVAASLVLVGGGSVRQVADAAPPPEGLRIALVLPRVPGAAPDDLSAVYASRVRDYAQFEPSLATPTILAGDVARAATAVARGRFDLVLWVGDAPETHAFAPRVRTLPQTRFVFLDASLETLGLRGVANAAAVRFAKEESSELVGYMSGLIHARGSDARTDVVSVVAYRSTRAARRVVDGFIRGARKAQRDIEVLVDVVPDGAGRGRCERLANEQIDSGSDVVFVAAGRCGAGAAAVARIRGAWAAGGEDVIDAGPHVLIRTYAEPSRAVDQALYSFLHDELPAGADLVLGLGDDYAVGIDTNSAVPDWIGSAVVRLCSTIREHAEQRS